MQNVRVGGGLDSSPGTAELSEIGSLRCAQLLGTKTIGRISWAAADGPLILPVTYSWGHQVITFRTSPYSVLSELVRPCDAAFEVDDFDQHAQTGWSVLVLGRAGPAFQPAMSCGLADTTSSLPWALSVRNLYIQIKAHRITGRLVTGTQG